MRNLVILDAASIGNDLDYSGFEQFGKLTIYEETSPQTLAERVKDADVLILNKVRLTRENLSGAKRLCLICEAATGFDNIDLDFCREKGIAVCNVVGYSTQSGHLPPVCCLRRIYKKREAEPSGTRLSRDCRQNVGHFRLWKHRETGCRGRKSTWMQESCK